VEENFRSASFGPEPNEEIVNFDARYYNNVQRNLTGKKIIRNKSSNNIADVYNLNV